MAFILCFLVLVPDHGTTLVVRIAFCFTDIYISSIYEILIVYSDTSEAIECHYYWNMRTDILQTEQSILTDSSQ